MTEERVDEHADRDGVRAVRRRTRGRDLHHLAHTADHLRRHEHDDLVAGRRARGRRSSPARDGRAFEPATAAEQLTDALRAGSAREVELDVEVTAPDLSTDRAAELLARPTCCRPSPPTTPPGRSGSPTSSGSPTWSTAPGAAGRAVLDQRALRRTDLRQGLRSRPARSCRASWSTPAAAGCRSSGRPPSTPRSSPACSSTSGRRTRSTSRATRRDARRRCPTRRSTSGSPTPPTASIVVRASYTSTSVTVSLYGQPIAGRCRRLARSAVRPAARHHRDPHDRRAARRADPDGPGTGQRRVQGRRSSAASTCSTAAPTSRPSRPPTCPRTASSSAARAERPTPGATDPHRTDAWAT